MKKEDIDFATAEKKHKQNNLFKEFFQFLSYNKKWWLLPILLVIFFLSILIFFGGSAAAPFIYTLF